MENRKVRLRPFVVRMPSGDRYWTVLATGPQVSRNSPLSDLANLTERNTRLASHVARLEQRLSEALAKTPGAPLASALPPNQTPSRNRPP